MPTRSSRSGTRARTPGRSPTRPGRSSTSRTTSQGVDVVIGDHNDLQVDAVRPNGVLVTENRAKGIRFTRVRIVVGPGKDGVVYKTADFHKPFERRHHARPGDPGEDRRAERPAGADPQRPDRRQSTKAIPRADQCGGSDRPDVRVAGRRTSSPTRCARPTAGSACSSRSRTRAACATTLTCPTVDIGGDFCPAFAPPPYPITRGQSLTVLPFGNIVGDAHRQRGRAEVDARERRLAHAGGRRPLPAGVGPLLHVRHRGGRRKPRDRGGAGRQRGQLHRDAGQPDGGRRSVQDRRERLHGRPAATAIRTSPAA